MNRFTFFEGMAVPINPTFSTLWAVNGPLDLDELRRQLDDFAEAGLDGVVFHPRFYPDEPRYLGDEYLAIVSTLIVDASERGLDFWIYDENGWPSGTVGGRMLERHPELRQRWVELQPDMGQPSLSRFDHGGASWALVERFGGGVDYLAPELAGRFIELCYARYAGGLAPEAFARVAGFFSDEPEFGLGHAHHELSPHGAIPWTPDLPERFAEHYGSDLLEVLPAVFVTDARSAQVREQFWELVTDLFAERYLARLDGWCRERGLRFTAHVKGEEHPLFQLPTVGSLGPVVRAVGLPGIDALGRHPVNDFYPRQASAIAHQFGDGRTMAEAFGGAGWGASPADLERYLRWLAGHGITDFVLHLSQYRLDSAAIEDWPPSHPRHVSWSAAYADVLAAVRAGIEAEPRPRADVLVVVPQRALARVFEPWEFVATNVHDAHDFPATLAGAINAEFLALVARLQERDVAYEFADERTLERDGAVVDGCLVVGRSRYARVVLPPAAELDPGVRQAIEPLLDRTLLDEASVTRSIEVSPTPPPPPTGTARRVQWRLERSPVNELVLEATPSSGEWVAVVESLDFAGLIELRFADEPAMVAWGDEAEDVHLDARRAGDLWVGAARIDSGARVRLRFRLRAPLPAGTVPRVWVAGVFRVRGEFRACDGAVSSFEGPFRLGAATEELDRELVEAGFPFLFEPLELVADVAVPLGADTLTLTGGVADAAGISIDDGPMRWRWPDSGSESNPSPALASSGSAGTSGWSVPLDAAGPVRVRLLLTPSSFNRYGPHHHYVGDPVVVSPAQMQGERNYADLDDAPERTHVSAWWVRRLVLPEAAVFGASGPASSAVGTPIEAIATDDVDNSRTALVK